MKRRSALFMAALGAFLLTGGGVATAGDHLKCYVVKDKTPDNRAQVEPGNNKRPVDLTSSTGLLPETFAQQGCVVAVAVRTGHGQDPTPRPPSFSIPCEIRARGPRSR